MKRRAMILVFNFLALLAFSSNSLAAGIGLEIAIRDHHVIITGLAPNCPASRQANIKIGDEIIKIQKNGASEWKSLIGLTLEQIKELMEGNPEQSIKLQLHRATMPDWIVTLWRQEGCGNALNQSSNTVLSYRKSKTHDFA